MPSILAQVSEVLRPLSSWISGNAVVEIVKILVVPLIVAWVAAKLGVRRGLEQAKRERAFDRSLEWHENAIRAMTRFSDMAWRLHHELMFSKDIPGLGIASQKRAERALRYLPTLEECTIELERVLAESVLFADRQTAIKLREDVFGLHNELLWRVQDLRREQDPDKHDVEEVSDFALAFAQGFRKLSFALSQKIRGNLNLEPIEPDDLKTEEEKAQERDREREKEQRKTSQ
jgi:hypothetical protein